MKKYVLYKLNDDGTKEYLDKRKKFTFDVEHAEVHEVKWWIQLLELILRIIIALGIKVKYEEVKK